MPSIALMGTEVEYEERVSKRAKRLSVVVHWDGRVEAVIPEARRLSERHVRNFMRSQADWILRNRRRLKKNGGKVSLTHQGVPRALVTSRTRSLVERLLDHHGDRPGFRYVGVKVRPYKTRWGSCNAKRLLCFHYKLCLLPGELAEYVVIHELCHTVHFNHSKRFWALVEACCPDYRDRRRALKGYLL